ncbi:MAG TPA: DUF2513 domain-containing protein [Syntrophales bacterium]|nr:DUF2513 domain-containing protein [Syntrophales bacterium]
MKRDMDLIRLLLLELEGESDVKESLSKYSDDQRNFHKALLLEAGFVIGPSPVYSGRGGKDCDKIPARVHIHRITWQGYEFLEKICNETIWAQIKQTIIEKGLSFPIDTISYVYTVVVKSLFGQ